MPHEMPPSHSWMTSRSSVVATESAKSCPGQITSPLMHSLLFPQEHTVACLLSAVDSFHCAGDRGLAAEGKGKITRVLAWPISEYVKELNSAGKALLIPAVEKSGRRWLVYKTSAPPGNCMSAAAPSILLMQKINGPSMVP